MELLVSPYGNHVAGAHEGRILHKYTRQGLVSSAAGKLSLGLTLEKQLLQVAEKRTVQSVCLSPLKPDHEASETVIAGRDRLRDSGLRHCLNRVRAVAQSIWDAVGFRGWLARRATAPQRQGNGERHGCG